MVASSISISSFSDCRVSKVVFWSFIRFSISSSLEPLVPHWVIARLLASRYPCMAVSPLSNIFCILSLDKVSALFAASSRFCSVAFLVSSVSLFTMVSKLPTTFSRLCTSSSARTKSSVSLPIPGLNTSSAVVLTRMVWLKPTSYSITCFSTSEPSRYS